MRGCNRNLLGQAIPGGIKDSCKSQSGFTTMELLVSSTLGLIILGLILGSSVSQRNIYRTDLVRARANESLRGAVDILAANVRLAGENLGSAFPAFEVLDSGNSDTLLIRRNLLSEVLPLCADLAINSTSNAQFAIPGSVAGCTYSGQTTNFEAWRNYRTSHDGAVDAYIWNGATRVGEFFKYIGETDNGTSYSIRRQGNWTRAYAAASSSIYMLEEWQIRRSGDSLQLITNQDVANPSDLAFGLTAFDVSVTMKDHTVVSNFSAAGNWTLVRLLTASLTVRETLGGKDYARTLQGHFFPRNVLSN